MKTPLLLVVLLSGAVNTGLQAADINAVQQHYRNQGAGPFDYGRGEQLWKRRAYEGRECAACHGADLKQAGRHERTLKPIEPMALSANSARYTDLKKVEKWFTRNCKWTWGRECTPQEKGDLLEFLKRL